MAYAGNDDSDNSREGSFDPNLQATYEEILAQANKDAYAPAIEQAQSVLDEYKAEKSQRDYDAQAAAAAIVPVPAAPAVTAAISPTTSVTTTEKVYVPYRTPSYLVDYRSGPSEYEIREKVRREQEISRSLIND